MCVCVFICRWVVCVCVFIYRVTLHQVIEQLAMKTTFKDSD